MIKSIADINKIRESKQADLMIRVNPDASPTKEGGKMHIMVCGGTGCTSSNSMKIIERVSAIFRAFSDVDRKPCLEFVKDIISALDIACSTHAYVDLVLAFRIYGKLCVKAYYAVYLGQRDLQLFSDISLYFKRQVAVYFLRFVEYRDECALSIFVLCNDFV